MKTMRASIWMVYFCSCFAMLAGSVGCSTVTADDPPAVVKGDFETATTTQQLDDDCSTGCFQDYLICRNDCAGDTTCIASCTQFRQMCLNFCAHQ